MSQDHKNYSRRLQCFFLAFGLEFFRDLLLVLWAVRWLLGVLLVLFDGLESQSWFHGNQSWYLWSQLWLVSPRLMLVLYDYLVVKQVKVGFIDINFGFHETNFDFPSHQTEQEVRQVITELLRVQGEDL